MDACHEARRSQPRKGASDGIHFSFWASKRFSSLISSLESFESLTRYRIIGAGFPGKDALQKRPAFLAHAGIHAEKRFIQITFPLQRGSQRALPDQPIKQGVRIVVRECQPVRRESASTIVACGNEETGPRPCSSPAILIRKYGQFSYICYLCSRRMLHV